MQQQEPHSCEYCLEILGLDAARLCQRVFSPEPYQLPLPLSPPPVVPPRIDPRQVALPLSPPVRFDHLTDASNAPFISQPCVFAHNVQKTAHIAERKDATSHEYRPPQHGSESEKDDERKCISIRELFDDDGMDGPSNSIIPPEVMDYVGRNPPDPNSIWYPDWYRYHELRHLITDHTWSDHLPPPSIPQSFPMNDTQRQPPPHQPWTCNLPPGRPRQPLLRDVPPYATMPRHGQHSLPPPAPPSNPQHLDPQTEWEIKFAKLTIGLHDADIRAIFRHRWRSLDHRTWLMQLSCVDEFLKVLRDDGYEWSESAFEPWEGREEELRNIEDKLVRELEMAQIGVIGDGRKMVRD